MRHACGLAFLLLIAALHLAAVPATIPVAPAPERGRHVRAVLLRLLEQSCRNDGVWPTALPSEVTDLTYVRPSRDADSDPDFTYKLANATVVLHESLDQNPGGVWVGYADGHLEFAPDAAALAECKAQVELARGVRAVFKAYVDAPEDVAAGRRATTRPTGRITLRLLDPEGRPVAGALVGSFGLFGDADVHDTPHAYVMRGARPNAAVTKVTSGADGRVTLDADDLAVSAVPLRLSPSVPLYVLDEARGLSALVAVSRTEFAAGATRDVRLAPTCAVRGRLTSLALDPVGRSIHWTGVDPYFAAGHFAQNPIDCRSNAAEFELKLPPGDYELRVRTDETNSAVRYVRIPPGRREVNLLLDLEPVGFDLAFNPDPDVRPLIGRPAPELRSIRAWKNSVPLTLASLRGRVVILDFWGHWCGYCVASMPDLMKLYDEFHDQGLEVIGIHDNSVESIREMDQKLGPIRAKLWAGRDLPFPVALDGGRPPAVKDEDHPFHGDTTAAYHVPSFPTTLVVGRDGTVLAQVDVRNPDTRARIIEFLKSPAAPAK